MPVKINIRKLEEADRKLSEARKVLDRNKSKITERLGTVEEMVVDAWENTWALLAGYLMSLISDIKANRYDEETVGMAVAVTQSFDMLKEISEGLNRVARLPETQKIIDLVEDAYRAFNNAFVYE